MTLLRTIVAFIIALGLLIVVHEYGHYIVAAGAASRCCASRSVSAAPAAGAAAAIAPNGSSPLSPSAATSRCSTSARTGRGGRGAPRVQPPERIAPLRHRGRGTARQFPVRHRGLRRAFHAGLPEARPVLGAPPQVRPRPLPGYCAPATPCARSTASHHYVAGAALAGSAICATQRTLRLEVVNEKDHLRDALLDLRSFPADDVEADALERIGLRLYRPPLDPVIGQVVRGGAAERAGLAPGDRVILADGKPVESLGSARSGGAGQARAAAYPDHRARWRAANDRSRAGVGGGGRAAHRPHRRGSAVTDVARRQDADSRAARGRRACGRRY